MDNREIRLLNLRYAIAKVGSIGALAERAECSKKYLEQIVQGFQGPKDKSPRKVGDGIAARIAAVLGEEPYWMDQPHPELWNDPGEVLAQHPVERQRKRVADEDDGSIRIPQFATGGAMGDGLELRDQPGVIESWSVTGEWLHQNVRGYSASTNLCIVTGFGDSMRPLFNPGDPLIIDRGVQSVEFDAVYFFRVGSEGFIKRLQRIPTENGMVLRAKSENKKYDSWDITPSMDFEVFGRVLKVWRSEEF